MDPTILTCIACGADFPEGATDSYRDDEQDDLCPACGRDLAADEGVDD